MSSAICWICERSFSDPNNENIGIRTQTSTPDLKIDFQSQKYSYILFLKAYFAIVNSYYTQLKYFNVVSFDCFCFPFRYNRVQFNMQNLLKR